MAPRRAGRGRHHHDELQAAKSSGLAQRRGDPCPQSSSKKQSLPALPSCPALIPYWTCNVSWQHLNEKIDQTFFHFFYPPSDTCAVDGGLSGGSSIRKPGSKDHHRRQRNYSIFLVLQTRVIWNIPYIRLCGNSFQNNIPPVLAS